MKKRLKAVYSAENCESYPIILFSMILMPMMMIMVVAMIRMRAGREYNRPVATQVRDACM